MKSILLVGLLIVISFTSTPGDGIEGCTGHESSFPLIDTQPELVS